MRGRHGLLYHGLSTGEALRLNVSSFLLHSVREAVASDRQAKQIFAGMYKYAAARGVDDFYLLRGCSLVQKPAILRIIESLCVVAGIEVPREELAGAAWMESRPIPQLRRAASGDSTTRVASSRLATAM